MGDGNYDNELGIGELKHYVKVLKKSSLLSMSENLHLLLKIT